MAEKTFVLAPLIEGFRIFIHVGLCPILTCETNRLFMLPGRQMVYSHFFGLPISYISVDGNKLNNLEEPFGKRNVYFSKPQ